MTFTWGLPLTITNCHMAPAYWTGCQLESWHPYPVSSQLFTIYSHTLMSVYSCHMDHSSEHIRVLVVTRLPRSFAHSISSMSATHPYLSYVISFSVLSPTSSFSRTPTMGLRPSLSPGEPVSETAHCQLTFFDLPLLTSPKDSLTSPKWHL